MPVINGGAVIRVGARAATARGPARGLARPVVRRASDRAARFVLTRGASSDPSPGHARPGYCIIHAARAAGAT